jgi:predicted O-methyltransferase YrrM
MKLIKLILNKTFLKILLIKDFLRYEIFIKKINYEKEQTKKFKNLGYNRNKARALIDKLINKNKNLQTEMFSEHQILFAAISLKKKINCILEIGTFDGKNSCLLAELYPKSKILTIDLPENDYIFKNTYNRNDYNKKNIFVKKRDQLIAKYKNIDFKKINSLNLINHKKNYDLIWIDGAHGFPYVTIDIINSLKLIKKNGLIICDDAYEIVKKNDAFYKSTATIETLIALEKSNVIKFRKIFKRLEDKYNNNPFNRKFITLVQPINNI